MDRVCEQLSSYPLYLQYKSQALWDVSLTSVLGDKDTLVPEACWPISLETYFYYVSITCVCLCVCMYVHMNELPLECGRECQIP